MELNYLEKYKFTNKFKFKSINFTLVVEFYVKVSGSSENNKILYIKYLSVP